MPLCYYGCEREAKHQFKNGKWSCEKNFRSCTTARKRLSKTNTGKKYPNHEKPIPIVSKSLCSYGCGKEAKYKFKNGILCCSERHIFCPSIKNKLAESVKILWEKEDYRKKSSESHIGQKAWNKGKSGYFSEESKKRIGDTRRGKKCPEHSIRMTGPNSPRWGKKHTEETKKVMRKKGAEKFLNQDYLQKYKEVMSAKPNKKETFLNELFIRLFGNKYKYTGDHSFWIEGKNPDFVSFHDKKIIEHYGSYWHKGEDGLERIEHFKKHGYRCLIIWEDELKDLEKVKQKILEFDKEFASEQTQNGESN